MAEATDTMRRTVHGNLITAAICPDCNGNLSRARASMTHEWYVCEECGGSHSVALPDDLLDSPVLPMAWRD